MLSRVLPRYLITLTLALFALWGLTTYLGQFITDPEALRTIPFVLVLLAVVMTWRSKGTRPQGPLGYCVMGLGGVGYLPMMTTKGEPLTPYVLLASIITTIALVDLIYLALDDDLDYWQGRLKEREEEAFAFTKAVAVQGLPVDPLAYGKSSFGDLTAITEDGSKHQIPDPRLVMSLHNSTQAQIQGYNALRECLGTVQILRAVQEGRICLRVAPVMMPFASPDIGAKVADAVARGWLDAERNELTEEGEKVLINTLQVAGECGYAEFLEIGYKTLLVNLEPGRTIAAQVRNGL